MWTWGPRLPCPVRNVIGNELLSPDGTRLVYVSGNPTRLYTRRLDQSKANELPGTEGADLSVFLAGRAVGGVLHWQHWQQAAEQDLGGRRRGGSARGCRSASAGGSWGADGNIIVGQVFTKGLVRVPASGGAPATVLDLAPGELFYGSPQILPGGKAVLFVDHRTPDANTASIEVFSFADRRRKTLVQGSTFARYLPSGHLVYMNKGTLFAIPFDVDRLETRGTAVPVLDDVAYYPQGGDVTWISPRPARWFTAGAAEVAGRTPDADHSMGGRRGQERTAAGQARRLFESADSLQTANGWRLWSARERTGWMCGCTIRSGTR